MTSSGTSRGEPLERAVGTGSVVDESPLERALGQGRRAAFVTHSLRWLVAPAPARSVLTTTNDRTPPARAGSWPQRSRRRRARERSRKVQQGIAARARPRIADAGNIATTEQPRIVEHLVEVRVVRAASGDAQGDEDRSLSPTMPGLTVITDAPVSCQRLPSRQLWPYGVGRPAAVGRAYHHGRRRRRSRSSTRASTRPCRFRRGRVVDDVDDHALQPQLAGDGCDHGTFVAGIAAGSAAGLGRRRAAAPNVVSLDVMDDSGMARTSDVIAACRMDPRRTRRKYNIRVANFSLHSTDAEQLQNDPLDKAVEKLWFNGIVVVAAAGNYGKPEDQRRSVRSRQRSVRDHGRRGRPRGHDRLRAHDVAAPWSAYGYTLRRLREAGLAAPAATCRPGAGGRDARARQAPENVVEHRVHAALGHVVRGSGRRRRGCADPRAASDVDARPGQGRSHAARAVPPGCAVRLGRRRQDQRRAGRRYSAARRTRTRH